MTDTPPTDDEREELAALVEQGKLLSAITPELLRREDGRDTFEWALAVTTAALAYLAPFRAAAEAAAYQRGVADERARVVAWLRANRWKGAEFLGPLAYSIETGAHTKGDEG